MESAKLHNGLLDTYGDVMLLFTSKTGFGYYQDSQGHNICLAELPPGQHLMHDGYFFIEVNNREQLDQVQIWDDPDEILRNSQTVLVTKKARRTAIDLLIVEGKLPPDYTED